MRYSMRFPTAVALAAIPLMSAASDSMARVSEQSGGWQDVSTARAPARSSTAASKVRHSPNRSSQISADEVAGPPRAVDVNSPPRGHDQRRDCQYITGAYNGLFGLGLRC
jgi:hypothetical protein